MNIPIGESKKKIYTIPEGEYTGIWEGYFCWVDENSVIVGRFETKKRSLKRNQKVKVIITGTKAKIYAAKQNSIKNLDTTGK